MALFSLSRNSSFETFPPTHSNGTPLKPIKYVHGTHTTGSGSNELS